MKTGRLRARKGDRRPLTRVRTDFTGPFDGKDDAREFLDKRLETLESLQEKLYAQRQYALLIVVQGMDTAGKDSLISHVFRGFNPSGIVVHSFKQPSTEELAHDFLWRGSRVLPARGEIAIFNRSYYEEVVVTRVHPELLQQQGLPPECATSEIWRERFDDIRAYERHLWRSGTVVVKFFLNISRREQEKRLLDRIDDKTKNWKFSAGDLPERAKWSSYMTAYNDAIAETTSDRAPWYVIPADHKWFAHAAVADVLVDTLSTLNLRYPRPSRQQRREFQQARRDLRKS